MIEPKAVVRHVVSVTILALSLPGQVVSAQVVATDVSASNTLSDRVAVRFHFASANGAFRVVRDGVPLTCITGGTDQEMVYDDRGATPGVRHSYAVQTYAPGDYRCQGSFTTTTATTGARTNSATGAGGSVLR